MDDIRAVLDACDVERAALVGISEGGPLAILFAATYPERVSHLALYASYAWGGGPSDRTDALCDAIETGWGTGMMADIYVQGCDERARQDLARFERFACTPTSSAEKMRFDAEIDVRPVLNAVRAPTLVLHNEHDPAVNVKGGRQLAAGIPDAAFVELSGDFHGHWDPARYEGSSRTSRSSSRGTSRQQTPMSIVCSPRCCSATSSTRQRWPTRSVIGSGGPCSTSMTGRFDASSTATGAAR